MKYSGHFADILRLRISIFARKGQTFPLVVRQYTLIGATESWFTSKVVTCRRGMSVAVSALKHSSEAADLDGQRSAIFPYVHIYYTLTMPAV